MTTRAALHELVDQLPDDLLDCAAETIGSLGAAKARSDALTRLLEAAPYDDEPYPEHQRLRVDEAIARLENGGLTFSTEQVLWIVDNLAPASSK